MNKRTKIVCTMGPACDDDNILREMIKAGMNVARFNFSHGSHEEQHERMARVKRIAAELGKPVLASMDGAGFAAVQQAGGLSSPACDAAALANSLNKLYAMTTEQRAEMGRRAKEYYLAHYRRAQLLRRLEEFILNGTV